MIAAGGQTIAARGLLGGEVPMVEDGNDVYAVVDFGRV